MEKPTDLTPAVDDRRLPDAGHDGIDDRRMATTSRRAAPRIRTLKGAQIVFAGEAPIPCVVRNISETGARLELRTPVLHNAFDLVFDDNEWPQRACRVVWRKANGIGVTFEAAADGIATVPVLAKVLQPG
jgi:hypothetical protein